MNQKITFKEWLANFFKGIWQALCWVGRAFNPKHKTTFWRVVWAAITICVVAVTYILAHSYYIYNLRHDYRDTETQRISANLAFVKKSGDKAGFIKNFHTGEAVTKDIEWIALPTDEDSLIVFSRKDKRGYLNRFSGEIAIPAKYPKAWVFSSGVASVAEGDSVYFIDHSGKPVRSRSFCSTPRPAHTFIMAIIALSQLKTARWGLSTNPGVGLLNRPTIGFALRRTTSGKPAKVTARPDYGTHSTTRRNLLRKQAIPKWK